MKDKLPKNEIVPMPERDTDWSAAEAELARGYIDNAEVARRSAEEFWAIDQEGFESTAT